MEMNFPHQHYGSGASSARQDFSTLLSKAISRQGNSPTALAMVLAWAGDDNIALTNEDSLGDRIAYFSGRLNHRLPDEAPHGAFYPTTGEQKRQKPMCDQPVYQDASMYSKDHVLSHHLSEAQTALVGQKNSRTI
jgi:hypothetical protein